MRQYVSVHFSCAKSDTKGMLSFFFETKRNAYRNQQKSSMRMLKKLGVRALESILIGLETAIKKVNTSLWSYGYQQSKALQVMK